MKQRFLASIFLALMSVIVCAGAFPQTRIRFARNRTAANVVGSIAGNGNRTFVLTARRGQFLSANVSSRNGCIRFDNNTTAISYITERGDNLLYLKNRCSRSTSFTITVSVNFGSD